MERLSSQSKAKGLGDSFSPWLSPTHLQYIPHLSLHLGVPLKIPQSVIIQCHEPEKEGRKEEKRTVILWVAGSTGCTTACPSEAQTIHCCSFPFLPHQKCLTILHLAEKLQLKWLNLTFHIVWGNVVFQRGHACMSWKVEEQFGPRSFVFQGRALITVFLSKRAQHDVVNSYQMHMTCSDTVGVFLNIRHYNTRLFVYYSQDTEFT